MAPRNRGLSGLPKEVRQSLRGLQRSLARSGRQMAAEREADFAVTSSAIDAIFANLARNVPRSGAQVARTNAQLGRLLAKSRAGVGRVERAGERLTAQYGTALGGVVQQELGRARAAAQAGAAQAGAAARAGRQLGAAAQTVGEIAASGVSAIRASASWAANQALQQRTALDATTLAQLEAQGWQAVLGYATQSALQAQAAETQTEQMRLQAELARENMEFEFNLQQQQAAEAMTPQLQLIVNQTGQYGIELMKAYNAASGVSPAQAAAAVAAQLGITGETEAGQYQMQILQALAQKMYAAGAGPDMEGNVKFNELSGLTVQAIQETIGTLYPDFAPDMTAINQYLLGFIGNSLLYPRAAHFLPGPTGRFFGGTVGADLKPIQNPYFDVFNQ